MARLYFALGRGGAARYLMDVASLPGGVLDSRRNPLAGLVPTPGTAFASLGDGIGPPWMGTLAVDANRGAKVAVFASGHVRDLDFASVAETPRRPDVVEAPGTTATGDCAGAGGLAAMSGLDANICTAAHTPGCLAGNGSCYDGLGMAQDEVSAPLTWSDGVHETAAIRLHFSSFDLEPGDRLEVLDAGGNTLASYTGQELDGLWSAWFHDTRVVLRLVTDGVDMGGYAGYALGSVEVRRGRLARRLDPGPSDGGGPTPGFRLGVDHRPEVWAVDLDRWNGPSLQPFHSSASNRALRLRITSDCSGSTGEDLCVDRRTSPDLADMVCPISGEVSVWMEDGRGERLYWGDQCGQIWKAWWTSTDSWQARKLISLNSGRTGYGRAFRKLMTRLDLVPSACTGSDAVGVYFATGDLQRPEDRGLLRDPTITDGRELVGVLWDDGELPEGLTQRALVDVTNQREIDPSGFASDEFGWALRLGVSERTTTNPLVIDNVAYFRMSTPAATADACAVGSSQDRILAMNSCTAAPVGGGPPAAREKWAGDTSGGGGLFIHDSKEAGLLISHGDVAEAQEATLTTKKKTLRLYLFRSTP